MRSQSLTYPSYLSLFSSLPKSRYIAQSIEKWRKNVPIVPKNHGKRSWRIQKPIFLVKKVIYNSHIIFVTLIDRVVDWEPPTRLIHRQRRLPTRITHSRPLLACSWCGAMRGVVDVGSGGRVGCVCPCGQAGCDFAAEPEEEDGGVELM